MTVKRRFAIPILLLATVLSIGSAMMMQSDGALLENDESARHVEVSRGPANLPDEQVPLEEVPVPEADPYEGLTEQQIKYVEEVVRLVNEAREKEGLAPLTLDTNLRKAAQIRAKECVGHFSHYRPDGTKYKTAIEQAGVRTGYTGENVASGYKTAQHVVSGWLKSDGHRDNILNPNFTIIGVGLEKNVGNGYKGYAWCQLFVK